MGNSRTSDTIEHVPYIQSHNCTVANPPPLTLERYLGFLCNRQDSEQLLRDDVYEHLPRRVDIGLCADGSPGCLLAFGSRTRLCRFHTSEKSPSCWYFCIADLNISGASAIDTLKTRIGTLSGSGV